MNDRALRDIVIGLGATNGYTRQDGFDITVASEVMAVFCLSEDLDELEARLGRMIVAETRGRRSITAKDLRAAGAMTALLQRALQPNLVQTLEGSPALIHGGPFANIAHGCNSIVATRAALRMADYVVTEAGFGADLGAEKFFDIKCRQAGLQPAAAVVVATVRALKMNGGVPKSMLAVEDLDALERGLANLARHVENVRKFGVDALVAINRFDSDTPGELALIERWAAEHDVEAVVNESWARGAAGAEALARAAVRLADASQAAFKPLYPDDMPLIEKVRTIAREIYRAKDVSAEPRVLARLAEWEAAGFGALPVCVAKTAYSFTADASILGAPTDFTMPLRDVRLRAGAGFVVALMGDIATMPGLPRTPAAERIRVENGRIEGLF